MIRFARWTRTFLSHAAAPPLRIARFTVENFRAITDPVEIAFGDTPDAGDPIVVFHGRNGAGKSTALLALALALLQRGRGRKGVPAAQWTTGQPQPEVEGVRLGRQGLTGRDFAQLGERPLRVRIDFQDRRLGWCEFVIGLSDGRSTLAVNLDRLEGVDEAAFQRWITSPFGPHSRPFDALDSRRYASWLNARAAGALIQPELAEALFALRVSRDPREREAWRYFSEVLGRFDAFRGKHVSIDRISKDTAPELTFEDRGKLILGLDDLSSGEQQLVALVAGVLLSNAAVLAIVNLAGRCRGVAIEEFARLVHAHLDASIGPQPDWPEAPDTPESSADVAPSLIPHVYREEMITTTRHTLIVRPLCEGLVTAMAVDFGHCIGSLPREVASPWKRSDDELFRVGLDNVQKRAVKRESLPIHGLPGLMLSAEDHIVTSHVQFLGNHLGRHFPAGALVALPTRNVLLCVARQTCDALRSVERIVGTVSLVHDLFEDVASRARLAEQMFSPHLYWWRDGALKALPAAMSSLGPVIAPPEDFLDAVLSQRSIFGA